MNVELVVSDLDGTLWSAPGRRVADETRRALAELEERDIPVLIATGRRARGARRALADLELPMFPGIFFDGAVGADLRDGTTFFHHLLDPELAIWIYDVFDAYGLSPCVYVDGPEDVLVGTKPSTHPDHLVDLAIEARTEDLRGAVWNSDVYGFALCGISGSRVAPVREALYQADDIVVRSTPDRQLGGVVLNVRPAGLHKWSGIQAFCAARGLDDTKVLAIGDSDNDIEMLVGAAVACVTADGTTGALEHAHHVVSGSDGWHEILAHLD